MGHSAQRFSLCVRSGTDDDRGTVGIKPARIKQTKKQLPTENIKTALKTSLLLYSAANEVSINGIAKEAITGICSASGLLISSIKIDMQNELNFLY